MGDDESQDTSRCIAPFPLLTKNAVENFRYRAEVTFCNLFYFINLLDCFSGFPLMTSDVTLLLCYVTKKFGHGP